MRDFDPTAGEFAGHDAIHAFGREHGRRLYDLGSALSLGGSVLGAFSSKSAADDQEAAAARSAALQQQQYEQMRNDLSGYRQTGDLANNKLAQLLGLSTGVTGGVDYQRAYDDKRASVLDTYKGTIDPGWTPDDADVQSWIEANPGKYNSAGTMAPESADFGSLLKKFTGQDLASDPGYQFRQAEGQKGVERSAASRGGLFSGAAAKALNKYNQDYASTEFGNAFNRDASSKNQIYSMLSGQQGTGLNAATMTGQAGQAAANNIGNSWQAGANASAAGTVGAANAINNGIGNYNSYNMINSLLKRGNGYNSGGGYSVPMATSGLYEGAYGG